MGTKVNQNTHQRVEIVVDVNAPGKKLADYRKRLGLSQGDFAGILGTNQKTLSRWEKAERPLPLPTMLVMAELVPELEKGYWLEHAGFKPPPVSPRDPRDIPVLHDPAAAGTGRVIDEHEVDYRITLPAHLLPPGGKLFGIHVSGNSMSPRLQSGDLVAVDITKRDVHTLNGRMVVAREDAEVTIKWLRKNGDQYLLVPENLSEHNIRIMSRDKDYAIIGEVVKLVGNPNPPRK